MKLFTDLLKIFKQPAKVDPVVFNDPLALKTAWEPLKQGGTNFRTHKAVQAEGNRLEFKPMLITKLFPLAIGLLPAIIIFFANLQKYTGADRVSLDLNFVFLLVFLMIFVAVGIYLYIYFGKTAIFDRNYGYFWKGRPKKGVPFNPAEQKDAVMLSEIHAIQVIPELVHSKNSRYYSYELNLVLKSGERRSVTDHGNKEKLLEDAQMLAQFLNVPVWNGIGS